MQREQEGSRSRIRNRIVDCITGGIVERFVGEADGVTAATGSARPMPTGDRVSIRPA